MVHDTTVDYLKHIHPDGGTSSISGNDWAELFLSVELSPAVAPDIRDLFKVAQGVLCYGCFFYPLYTLGSEQVCRVLEAALAHRYAQHSGPKRKKSFKNKIEWLLDNGHLSARHRDRWKSARQLRNMSSHANRQSLIGPDMAIGTIRTAAELIDDLFTS